MLLYELVEERLLRSMAFISGRPGTSLPDDNLQEHVLDWEGPIFTQVRKLSC